MREDRQSRPVFFVGAHCFQACSGTLIRGRSEAVAGHLIPLRCWEEGAAIGCMMHEGC